MQQVGTMSRLREIEACLARVPPGLHEMLQHVLDVLAETMTEADFNDLKRLITWLTVARRPLTLREVDAILKLDTSDEDGNVLLEEQLRTRFASLFMLTRADGRTTADLQTSFYEEQRRGHELATLGHTTEWCPTTVSFISYDSDAWTTDVTFGHASIREFFAAPRRGELFTLLCIFQFIIICVRDTLLCNRLTGECIETR